MEFKKCTIAGTAYSVMDNAEDEPGSHLMCDLKVRKGIEITRSGQIESLQGAALGRSPPLRAFCFHYSLGQLRTGFGPLAQWSRLYLIEFSK